MRLFSALLVVLSACSTDTPDPVALPDIPFGLGFVAAVEDGAVRLDLVSPVSGDIDEPIRLELPTAIEEGAVWFVAVPTESLSRDLPYFDPADYRDAELVINQGRCTDGRLETTGQETRPFPPETMTFTLRADGQLAEDTIDLSPFALRTPRGRSDCGVAQPELRAFALEPLAIPERILGRLPSALSLEERLFRLSLSVGGFISEDRLVVSAPRRLYILERGRPFSDNPAFVLDLDDLNLEHDGVELDAYRMIRTEVLKSPLRVAVLLARHRDSRAEGPAGALLTVPVDSDTGFGDITSIYHHPSRPGGFEVADDGFTTIVTIAGEVITSTSPEGPFEVEVLEFEGRVLPLLVERSDSPEYPYLIQGDDQIDAPTWGGDVRRGVETMRIIDQGKDIGAGGPARGIAHSAGSDHWYWTLGSEGSMRRIDLSDLEVALNWDTVELPPAAVETCPLIAEGECGFQRAPRIAHALGVGRKLYFASLNCGLLFALDIDRPSCVANIPFSDDIVFESDRIPPLNQGRAEQGTVVFGTEDGLVFEMTSDDQ